METGNNLTARKIVVVVLAAVVFVFAIWAGVDWR